MITYTTCRDCSGLLRLVDEYDTVHPTCARPLSAMDRLMEQWIGHVESEDLELESELEQQINKLSNISPRLLDSALYYARWGWEVFPLRKNSKVPATKNGFKDATTDESKIQSWWKQNPECNIGLATGKKFDVIDIDVPDGIPTYQKLLSEDRDIHGRVITSSGGLHLYIRPTGRGCSARWMPGADYRGIGGYVVAPPSTLGEGKSWSWQNRPSPMVTGVGDTYGK